MIRSVPVWLTAVTLLVRRNLRRRAMKGEGAAAVVRGKGSEVGAEAGVDDELLAVLWFGELEEEDARGEVVDVCETQRDELGRELVGDDLARVSTCTCEWWGV